MLKQWLIVDHSTINHWILRLSLLLTKSAHKKEPCMVVISFVEEKTDLVCCNDVHECWNMQ